MRFTPYMLPSAAAGLLLFVLAVSALQFRKAPSALPFGLTMISIAFWALVYSLEISSLNPGTKILMAQLRFVGIGPMTASWLVMALYHMGYRRQDRKGVFALLAIEPVLTAVLSLTGSMHRLFRYDFRMSDTGPIPMLTYTNGPFFWIHYAYMAAVFATIVGLLVRSLRGCRPWYRRQTVTVIIGTLLPLITDAIFQAGLTPVPGYNLSTPVMAVSGSLIAYAMFRYRLLSIAPIARSIVVENMEDLMLVLDEQGRLVDCNPAAEKALEILPSRDMGRPAKALLGSWATVLDGRDESETIRREIGEEGPDGRTFDLSVAPIVGKDDIHMGRMIVMHDISARKKAENELRMSEGRFRGLIEQSSEAIVLTDEQGVIIEFNPAAERLTGRARIDALGSGVIELQAVHLPPSVPQAGWKEKAQALIREALRTGDTSGLNRLREGRMARLDGSMRDFRQTAFPIRTDKGWRLGLVFNDITGIKSTEEALRRSQEDLAQAQKMEAIGRLAGGIAHDFNNLLTVIGGYAEVLEQSLPSDSPIRGDAGEIRGAAAKAAGLTAQLLAFGRKQVMEPRLLDLGTLVTDMEKMLRRLIGENIELVSLLQPGLERILADPGKIEQVVMNLVVNARDAMPRGGRLTLRTEQAGEAGRPVSPHPQVPAGRWILLKVSDTGVGMDAQTISRIFEPFFTTKEKGKGTGLGLATVYGIVRQSGGYVFCESVPDRGTTFTIFLPAADGAGSRPDTGETAAGARGSGTILLVEDEDAVRNFIRAGLEKNGYGVLEACDGSEALERLGRAEEEVHLLITDVVMPRMSGGELARRVRAERPRTRILFITGYAEDMLVPDGWEGEAAFLQKPFTIALLLSRIQELTKQR